MILNQNHLETRENLIRYFTRYLELELAKVNPAFRFFRIESPILFVNDKSAVRHTTMYAAHVAASNLLEAKTGPKYKLPLVIWEHGKTFQVGKKQTTESYTLEYNVLYSKSTSTQYMPILVRSWKTMLRKQCGKIFAADESDTGLSIFAHDSDTVLLHIQERSGDVGLSHKVPVCRDIEVVCNLDACTEANLQFEFGKIRRGSVDKK